jgi:hypothetical protein
MTYQAISAMHLWDKDVQRSKSIKDHQEIIKQTPKQASVVSPAAGVTIFDNHL